MSQSNNLNNKFMSREKQIQSDDSKGDYNLRLSFFLLLFTCLGLVSFDGSTSDLSWYTLNVKILKMNKYTSFKAKLLHVYNILWPLQKMQITKISNLQIPQLDSSQTKKKDLMFHKLVSMNFIIDFSLMSLIMPQVADQLIKDCAYDLCILLCLHHISKYQLSVSTMSMKREKVVKTEHIN